MIGFFLMIILIQNSLRPITSLAERVMLLDTILDDWRGWTTNTGRYSGWRSQNIPPNGDRVYGLCMIMRENNDNWLYSPIIPTGESNSIIIETFFSMRNCMNYPEPSKLKSCEEKINMLTFETDEIKESSSQDNKLFKQVAVLFPDKKWTQNEQEQPVMNAHKVSLPVKTLGIQIGYRDTGSCTMIRRVRVYYLVCPTVVSSFMEFPRTVTKHGYDLAGAQGSCVNGAISKNLDELQSRYCQSNGMWHDMAIENCHCAPGYTPSNDLRSCIPCAKGTYKPIAGSDRCSYCPKFSQSEPGQVRCRCDKEFYRKDIGSGRLIKSLCLQPPKAPEQLKANITDGYAVTLTWKYPESKEGVARDEIDYFHVSCSNCEMDKIAVSPSVNVTQLSVTIIGLCMGKNYFFHVSSMASISNHSTSLLFNPTRSSIHISLPKTNGIHMGSPKIVYNENMTLLISWTKPVDISVNLYMLQICMSFSIKANISRNECEYHFAIVNHHTYYTRSKCIQVTVKLRFKSKESWSEFSPESTMKIFKKGNEPPNIEVSDRISAETYSLFRWFPNLEVILLFVTSGILILILLTVSIILMRRHIYSTMKKNDSAVLGDSAFMDNTKSSYASITASSPSRGRSYFYLSSMDKSVTQQKYLEEIPSELIIMKSLDKKGKFYDIYSACLKQARKLPLKVTLYVLDSYPEIIKNLLEDVHEIFQFQHQNLLTVIGICSITKPQMIISENMSQGTLNGFLKRYHSTIDNTQLLQFLRDIACGLGYLAERKFIIKRLTSHRVYIDDSFVCKFSIVMREWNNEIDSASDQRNEIAWRAPELYSKNVHTTQSDVWAYGIVVWEVFSYGQQPYWNLTEDIIKQSVLNGYRLPPSNNCLSVIHDLMLQCWSIDSSQRPTFNLILSKIDQAINYVDDKQLIPTQKQPLVTLADPLSENDDLTANKMLNSISNQFMEKSSYLSDSHRNASLGNINDSNDFYFLKENKSYPSNKRSWNVVSISPENNKNSSDMNVSTNSNDNVSTRCRNKEDRRREKASTLQRHIKGQKVNLDSWLSEINMKKYKRIMTKHGYHNRCKLINLSIADLTEMGIRKASEIQILINNIQKLRNDEIIKN